MKAETANTGKLINCCVMMDYALQGDYLIDTIMLDGSSAPPRIPGPRTTPTGRKHKPDMFVNFCPFCGHMYQSPFANEIHKRQDSRATPTSE